jgi:hypothetical protein
MKVPNAAIADLLRIRFPRRLKLLRRARLIEAKLLLAKTNLRPWIDRPDH